MVASLRWQILCMYRQMENTSDLVEALRKLGGGSISRRVQQYLLEKVVQDEVVKRCPPEVTYTARLLKLVILGAESDALRRRGADSDDEEEPVLEETYAEHAKYMEAVSRLEHDDSLDAKWCYRTYAYATPTANLEGLLHQPRFSNGSTIAERARASDGTQEVAEQARVASSVSRAASKKTSPSMDPSTLEADDGTLSGESTNPALTQLVTVRVSLNLFEGGTGCTTWSAGFYLAEFALTHPETFAGKRVLELGAGAGVLGVVISRLPGVSDLVLTDGNEETLENLRGNLSLNEVETSTEKSDVVRSSKRPDTSGHLYSIPPSDSRGHPHASGSPKPPESPGSSAHPDPVGSLESPTSSGCTGSSGSRGRPLSAERTDGNSADAQGVLRIWSEFLDWEDVSELQLREYNADVILGADVLYDPGVIPDLVRILLVTLVARGSSLGATLPTSTVVNDVPESASDRSGKVAYIATAIRNVSTLERFVLAVKAAGLSIELVAQQEEDCFQYCRWMKREQIRLHRITCEN
ncbi:hypothetical protein KFL_000420040 [Klebsormidium nitens]|uniref:Uncharacterized protein n=1 Tax=Klebsormidium nitens TaxID=105231 RepID=A0A1Y1HQ66_KLENI|nr:hypothetical protein KFL_000420040 [Klebsormidium nitens]|eukprot:GAQ79932.1 hypothetical protein KFL_000420040 [Klebsormidium nitens]